MTDPYSGKPEVLLGDLRGGMCSSGLCRQLRAVAADEIERLHKWADGFSDRQLEERRSGEEYQRELRTKIHRLRGLLREVVEDADSEADTSVVNWDLIERVRRALSIDEKRT